MGNDKTLITSDEFISIVAHRIVSIESTKRSAETKCIRMRSFF
jgi:hypothetical protein